VTYPCAIAPLDQAATQLGWHQGSFVRDPCMPFSGSCTSRSEGLQFLADPGTPVIAPFDARLTRTERVLVLELPFAVPRAFGDPPVRVQVTGILPEAGNGLIAKGALLGRVARAERPAAVFTLIGASMEALFADLGLDIVGGERRPTAGYRLTPSQGGRLLVRASGPANCAVAAMHGFGDLGSAVAPAGYVEPDAGAYSRFGVSRLSHANVSPPGAGGSSGGLWGLFGWIAVGGVALWAARR